jgi:SAM-dependent methyltransferase
VVRGKAEPVSLRRFDRGAIGGRLLRPPPNTPRYRLERWLEEAARRTPAGSLLLDAGAGDQRYARLFEHTRYETADFLQTASRAEGGFYKTPTCVCDLTSIPVESDRFDVILCTQVLEHLPEPVKALEELCRVLRPGGELLLSAPLFYVEHEQPYDFYRYTQFGLRHPAERAGFEVRTIEWGDGYYSALALRLSTAAQTISHREVVLPGWVFLVVPIKRSFAALARLFARLDREQRVGKGALRQLSPGSREARGAGVRLTTIQAR